MNKKLLLGALVGAGVSLLNKKVRQQSIPGGQVPGHSRAASPASGSAVPGAAAAIGGAAVLGEMAKKVFGQMQQQGSGGAPGGGLSDAIGKIFGGEKGRFSQQGPLGPQASPEVWSRAAPSQGPAVESEEHADLMLKAMAAAAQADGNIDETELNNIAGALNGQLQETDLNELRQLLRQPVDVDQLVAQVPDPATALNVYLASAMTVNRDNPREQQYLQQLAGKLGISEQATDLIAQQLPRAA